MRQSFGIKYEICRIERRGNLHDFLSWKYDVYKINSTKKGSPKTSLEH